MFPTTQRGGRRPAEESVLPFFAQNAAVAQQEGPTPPPVLPVPLAYIRPTPSSPETERFLLLHADPR